MRNYNFPRLSEFGTPENCKDFCLLFSKLCQSFIEFSLFSYFIFLTLLFWLFPLLRLLLLLNPLSTPPPPCFDDIKLILPLGSRECNRRNTVTYLASYCFQLCGHDYVFGHFFLVTYPEILTKYFNYRKLLVFNCILLVMWKTLSHQFTLKVFIIIW